MPGFALLTVVAAVLAAGPAAGQTVYRIVQPDGRVLFSDQPPATAQGAARVREAPPPSGEPALPYAARQPASRFPVTLYSGPQCEPCLRGRALLVGRGIPFSERSITTAQDAAALQRLGGDASLPWLAVGRQMVRGFSAAEWTQYLDAAGYPHDIAWPGGYRNPVALPLAPAPAEPAPAVTSTEPAPPRPAATPPRPVASPNPGNPASIRF